MAQNNKSKPNYIYPILSIALVLFVLGIFLVLTFQTQAFVQSLKEKVDVWVELKPESTPTEAAQVISNIGKHPHVIPGSVTYLSNEEAAKMIEAELGDENMLDDLPNIMRDVVRFNIKAGHLNASDMDAFREEMKSDTLISEMFYETANAENITSNMEKLSRIALALGLLLIFVAIVLIHNTVRLALFTNRLLVKNMQMVGATNAFIQWPYLLRAALNGLWSALIAIFGLIAGWWLVQREMPVLKELESNFVWIATFALLIVLGLGISLSSTWFTLKKYLHTRIEELY